ncbi:MAG TPA: gliding motility-associated C-terminal domain-containing protein, partial [Flavitalea sp.]|nr:gliding motility-associated C-terminal domain-containing protein [Flavitalea sp.]
ITPSKCSGASGSIQQLQVTGGDRYEWMNTGTNTVVGNTPDVFNLSSGNYQLTVTNQYGCANISTVITIPQSTFLPIEVTNFISGNALCGLNNGFIKINSFNSDFNLYTFRWVDSISGQNFNGASLQNLGGGSYQLFAKDSNGCAQMIFSKRINSYPVPTFDYSQTIIKNDECNLHQGSISSLQVNGLVGPTTYTWYDQNNNIAGNTLSLLKAVAGTYIMKVSDGGVCTIQSTPFILNNNNNNLIAAPLYDNIVIPRYSDAALTVKNSAPGRYELYIDAMGLSTIQQSNNGNFVVPKIPADTIFYIKRISGSCSSPLVPIKIRVVDKSYFSIPSAFTPNGDGKNDRLSVKVMGYIDLIYFSIYNRWGQLVYETREINEGWDGTIRGILQNGDSFVWVAQGKDINGKLITGKGSFILIR